jgi:hypothetical protein
MEELFLLESNRNSIQNEYKLVEVGLLYRALGLDREHLVPGIDFTCSMLVTAEMYYSPLFRTMRCHVYYYATVCWCSLRLCGNSTISMYSLSLKYELPLQPLRSNGRHIARHNINVLVTGMMHVVFNAVHVY